MTIAFAVALSAFNAVTLTPALSALLLERESHHKGRFFTFFERGISAGTNGYVRALRRGIALALGGRRRLHRHARADLVGATARCRSRSCPTRIRATSSPRCRRRPARRSSTPANIATAGGTDHRQRSATCWRSSRSWASASAARPPTRASCSSRLKPFDQRKGADHSAAGGARARVGGPLFAHSRARSSSASRRRRFPGLSRFGGFEFQVLDQTGTRHRRRWRKGTQAVVAAGNQSPKLRGLVQLVHRQ